MWCGIGEGGMNVLILLMEIDYYLFVVEFDMLWLCLFEVVWWVCMD